MGLNQKIVRKLMVFTGVVLFLVFVGFSYLVAKETFSQLDFDMTVKIQDKMPRRVDYIFSWFSALGSAEATGVIWFLVWLLVLFKKFWKAALAMFLLPAALAIEVFGKVFVHHPAPPFLFYRGVLDIVFPSNFVHDFYSYPSGHETRSAFLVVFLMAYLYFRMGVKTQLLTQAMLVGILAIMTVSRIYLGEHWTTDVVGGFLIGTSFGLLAGVWIPSEKHHNRKEVTAFEER